MKKIETVKIEIEIEKPLHDLLAEYVATYPQYEKGISDFIAEVATQKIEKIYPLIMKKRETQTVTQKQPFISETHIPIFEELNRVFKGIVNLDDAKYTLAETLLLLKLGAEIEKSNGISKEKLHSLIEEVLS
ncbi:MAG: hypothetical protein IAX22_04825 [Candidatus Bathyarchaeota archaeon]|nr:hypothetical protein [Candidatus Bathyarchaeota archaeon]